MAAHRNVAVFFCSSINGSDLCVSVGRARSRTNHERMNKWTRLRTIISQMREIIWIFSSLFFLNFSVRFHCVWCKHVSCSIIHKSVYVPSYCVHWKSLRADDGNPNTHTHANKNKSFNQCETKHYFVFCCKNICSLKIECVYCYLLWQIKSVDGGKTKSRVATSIKGVNAAVSLNIVKPSRDRWASLFYMMSRALWILHSRQKNAVELLTCRNW